MRKKTELDLDLLLRLRDKGLSMQAIAIRFGVNKVTIKRRLEELKPEERKSDPQVMSFAVRLQKLAAEAPDHYCRNEVLRAVLFLRTKHSMTREQKKERLVEVIADGARTILDMAADMNYVTQGEREIFRKDVEPLLEELISENRIRKENGIHNQGRKRCFHYHINRAAQPSSNFNLSFPPGNRPVPASF
jgi:hypothetical protein